MKFVASSFVLLFFSVVFTGCERVFNKSLFTQVSETTSHINFENKLPKKERLNILYYLYYYNGAGVSVGDINNDNLPDIYFTANTKGGNKLYLNKGGMQFEDITITAGVAGTADWSTGSTMVDINHDGKLDIVVCAVSGKFGLEGHNQVFINQGNNQFTESSNELGLDFYGLSVQMAFFDYDRDGDLDAYLLNQSYFPHANIVDTSFRQGDDILAGDILYRNDINTTGKFTKVSKEAGIYQSKLGYGLGLAVADLNNDGWDDIYIGNDFHENDYYYINQHNGTFKESGAAHFKHYSRFSMGNDINDYNNDGQPDLITVDMLPPDEKTLKTYGSDEHIETYNLKLMRNGYQHQVSRNTLQQNNGNGISFSDVALQSGVAATDWSWAPLFADFDNDGNKDLFVSSGIVKRPVDLDYIKFISDLTEQKGMDKTDKYDQSAIDAMPDGSSHPFFFWNNGDGAFEDRSASWGTSKMKGYYNGAAYADLDKDGDLDMVVNSLNSKSFILENHATKNTSMQFVFHGDSLNPFGIGTKLYAFADGKLQYQQMHSSRGFQSAVEPKLHFGFGHSKTIDSLIVVWPNQQYQVIKHLAIQSNLILEYNNALQQKFNYSSIQKHQSINFTKTNLLNWKHEENDYIDNNSQYLIPHFASTRGPKMAVADVNEDGLDDLFVGGAKDQLSALWIQQAKGGFKQSNQQVFESNTTGEDLDAIFFDANGDKHLDLLVVTGGNQNLRNGREGEDRLYINDGKGNFKKDELAFQQQYENKSCVTVADIDKDGDMDFFIGNMTKTNAYGEPTHSFMYINRGNGKFDMAKGEQIFLQSLGMVTAAAFADVNGDQWPDLIVAGEWMPIKIFINHKGKFSAIDLPKSTGLWQSILVSDINQDGKLDFLGGNWGKNSKLYAGKDGPLKLYLKDFDNNNSIEQVMAYTIKGKEYPFFAKDELEIALPVLKKGYLRYSEVAGKTVQFMFDDLFKDYKELKAEVLASSAFINNGDGQFSRVDLPATLQRAPIFSFLPYMNTSGTYIAGGNFYGVTPYEGRYDAQIPVVFKYQNKQFQTLQTIPSATKELRDLKWIKTKQNQFVLAIANNNDSLQFFQPIK